MKIQVILGSTRPGRAVERVAQWVETAAADFNDFELETVDLADYDLPFFDEEVSPRYNPDRKPNAQAVKWIDKLAEADGYVILAAEYNHSVTGALKNALDYVTNQMAKKPALIVSYGSVGGARAAEHLKGILNEAQVAVVPQSVALIGLPHMVLSETGVLDETLRENAHGPQRGLHTGLNELGWWTRTLKAGRESSQA